MLVDEVSQLIRNRRTIKPPQYSSKALDRSIIEKILDAARWAPSHGLTEPWRFTVFTGAARKKFGDFMMELYPRVNPPEKVTEQKLAMVRKMSEMAPCIISIGMKRQESGKIPEIEEVCAVACAVQNMHLLATAYGLGAFWSSGAVAYAPETKAFLGLGEKDICLGFFYLGYPAADWPQLDRTPLDDKIKWLD